MNRREFIFAGFLTTLSVIIGVNVTQSILPKNDGDVLTIEDLQDGKRALEMADVYNQETARIIEKLYIAELKRHNV